ncbi:hypothetical protein EDB19DRAFT_1710518 [Suillus lakei]|nr:hypothetical protein EDB19DRAFT_1811705 [Suillus lakei]KAG1739538.1 hypothetical protein EDB19DRAFT_1710518 [Suillus lakei]
MQFYHRAQGYRRPVKQSKIASQRQYRVKEGDGFQELRDVICSVTGEVPQTRRETLKTAAELLRQLSKENGAISSHELKSSSASPYEVDQGLHTSNEPLLVPNNESTCTNTFVPWTENGNPMSETSATRTTLEYYDHPQEEVHHAVGHDSDWNSVQPNPSQFSFSSQWNDLSFIHLNIDQVPFYVEGVGMN